MTGEPLITVCIPAYNASRFIEQTLQSIQDQTYRALDIVVSDNASTDRTGEKVLSHASRDPRIRYFRNDRNIGYVGNIREAVARAKSDVIAIYHADDIYAPSIVQRQVEVLNSDPACDGVFVKYAEFYRDPLKARAYPVYRAMERSGLLNRRTTCLKGGRSEFLPLILRYGNIFACPSFMTRKNVYLRTGGFSDRYPSNEDLELWIRLLDDGCTLAIVNEYLLAYRKSMTQGSSQFMRKAELPVLFKVLDELVLRHTVVPSDLQIAYDRNKAVGYLLAAANALRARDRAHARDLALLSRRMARFPIFSPIGLCQRLPGLFALSKIVGQAAKRLLF